MGKEGENAKKEKKKKFAVLKHIVDEFSDVMETENPSRTALSRIFEELYHYATRDQLTGVFNRRALDEALSHEIVEAARLNLPLSCIMIDIDNFKRYNDTYGHLQGGHGIKSSH